MRVSPAVRRTAGVAGLVVLLATAGGGVAHALLGSSRAPVVVSELGPSTEPTSQRTSSPAPTPTLSSTRATAPATAETSPAEPALTWPAAGQASVEVGGRVSSSPGQRPVPIASVAKVMTAYLVLRDVPATASLTVTQADVDDTAVRRAHNQSVVAVEAGEVLTERQALEALLVPSANNVAVMLARQVAGSETAFVVEMNATARSLGLTATTYTDPSGYDAGTVSTAADQLRVVEAAMRLPTFAAIVGEPTAELPVAGTVRNNDALLGVDGFVGVKTGSSYAAGGAFAFRSTRASGRVVTGVVLGQGGSSPAAFIANGLAAARALADQIT